MCRTSEVVMAIMSFGVVGPPSTCHSRNSHLGFYHRRFGEKLFSYTCFNYMYSLNMFNKNIFRSKTLLKGNG